MCVFTLLLAQVCNSKRCRVREMPCADPAVELNVCFDKSSASLCTSYYNVMYRYCSLTNVNSLFTITIMLMQICVVTHFKTKYSLL